MTRSRSQYATVVLTGPTTRTLPTNSDGCAFFTFLPAGTYNIALTDAGYVDRQSNPSPAQTAGVTVGNITSVQYDFDLAATLQLTLVPPPGTAPPTDLPLTLYNTQFLPNGQKNIAGTGTTRTLTNLFPSLEGYQMWAGTCADADPEGIKMGTDGGGNPIVLGPYWPTGDRATGLSTAQGGSTAGTVALGGGNMNVTRAGLPVVGATVTATHAADNLCTSETHVLGVTDAVGQVHTALPYGTWKIMVTASAVVGGVWPNLTVDPTAGAVPTVVVPLV